MSDLSAWETATAVTRLDDSGRYAAELDPGWAIGGKPNGGYLLAILARAACDAVGTEHPLAVSAHYLRAPDSGPAQVRTEVVRSGRRASTSRAVLWQGDKPFLDATVTSGQLAHGEPGFAVGGPPAMPSPEECDDRGNPNFPIELFNNVDLRIDPTTVPFQPSDGKPAPNGEPTVRYWFRLRDGSEPDVMSLLIAVDSAFPTVFHLGAFGWAPTVELSVLLRGIPARGWLACEARTNLVADGWFDEEAYVWDSTGRLVAQSHQLALAGGGPQPRTTE
ncbi:MAG TPA: thioesterase family protein [Mycobacteriales bacterium]|nr:thioesterase family protein [Mycobacteriales bacterium]